MACLLSGWGSTRPTSTHEVQHWNVKKHNHTVRAEVFFTSSCLCIQVLPTAVLPRTKTARCLQSSRPTTPLFFLTWRLTPQSTTLSPWWYNQNSNPYWRGSRKSRSSLKPPWCLERARYQKEQTQTWSLAAILSAAPSPAAASVDGTNSHDRQSWRQCGKDWRYCSDFLP